LFVGGDFQRKGGDLLLEWFRTKDTRDMELHLVTRDPVPALPGVCVYPNLQPNSDALRDLFHRSDVFVLPSRSECFGIATVEAMAAGLPVVATDVGGAADIVDNGRTGYLIPGGDSRSLANALDSLTSDAGKRVAMGRAARDVAEQRFDIERNARRTLDRLKALATQHGSRTRVDTSGTRAGR
jgi:glycosyltransferase involved in cell wall biosynthesis